MVFAFSDKNCNAFGMAFFSTFLIAPAGQTKFKTRFSIFFLATSSDYPLTGNIFLAFSANFSFTGLRLPVPIASPHGLAEDIKISAPG